MKTAPVSTKSDPRPILITGGAGFVGTNLAARLLAEGHRVLIFDNLSRPGVEANLRWLKARYGARLRAEIADIRDPQPIREAVRQAGQVFHCAAQTAVTTSLQDPCADFEINLRGTVNLLEALRAAPNPPPLLFTSTNKVYGDLADIAVQRRGDRYMPHRAGDIAEHGVGETRPLEFHSPYGCSKGGADQYVLDYARTYGLATAVVRMSCIYGPHQCGTEDQGWVAHFLIRALENRPITLYGDGLQVRDVLFVDDLVRAFLLIAGNLGRWRGEVFNIGGGPANTVSLLELVDLIETLRGVRPELNPAPARQGDQKYYVSDTRKLAAATGWRPEIPVRQGVERTYAWLQMHAGKHSRYKENPATLAPHHLT
jgi:CDP-paratose 2-epimerase